MTVKVYTQPANSGCYVRVVAPDVDITYTPTSFGFLRRVVLPLDLTGYEVATHSLDSSHNYAKRANALLAETAAQIQKIVVRLGLSEVRCDRLECFADFGSRISALKLTERTMLDLSQLKLDSLPFQIVLFKEVRILNLSDNNLRVLPIDLMQMPHLAVVDLRGNPIVELPEWCQQKLPHVEFLTDIITDRENSRSFLWLEDDQHAPFMGSAACCDDVGA